MTRIVADNPRFTSPAQVAQALLDWADGKLSGLELAAALSKSQVAISRLPHLISNRKLRKQMPRSSLTRRVVVVTRIRCARTRARRTSPATAARASDSGGGSGDPEPEPPRRRSLSNLPTSVGGAL